ELYLENSYYHPMKWMVNYLPHAPGSKRIYFCLGYTILDNDRLKKFNLLAKKHYQLIMEGPAGIIFHDKNGELIAANQQTASIFTTTLEKLYQLKDISRRWKSKWLITNEQGQPVPFEKAPFMKALDSGKIQKETIRIQLENGENRWIRFYSQPLPDDHTDDCCWAVSTIIDVTNEKLLAARIEEKRALINAFVRQTPNLAWVVDDDSRLQFASEAFYQYFNLDKTVCTDKKMSELVPPFVFRALYEKHLDVFKTGNPQNIVEQVKLANGTNYISHINIFPINGIPGKKLLGGYAINLPDTGKIEKELLKAHERLLTISRAASNAIWEWDMQTGTIFRNEALMEMIGYQPDNSKGLSWWLRRVHPEDRDRVSDKVKEATDTCQHSWQDEYRFKCADGRYKHVQDKGFVMYESGLPVKMIGSLQDISNLKELENKLADEKLQRQKEISETIISVQEKERTRIGHELHDNVNQVLSTALLFLEMLNPSGKEQKQVKIKSAEYLSTAIEEIRKLSKELVVPHFKEQGLVNSIQLLIDDIHIASAIRVKFTHDLESDLLSSGKKITLFRIVQEQLKNILNHSGAKNAEILLQTRHDDVQLIIKDNGIGFDPKQTRRGIGLSNIYERISFYNGHVDIQTSPGNGCTVVVTMSLL
ncbi:MAG: PAS domain-containing protein, partial [Bacteroidota bacterium]|nr:PAS domain-containing protein [Bacteroidota bacterium]